MGRKIVDRSGLVNPYAMRPREVSATSGAVAAVGITVLGVAGLVVGAGTAAADPDGSPSGDGSSDSSSGGSSSFESTWELPSTAMEPDLPSLPVADGADLDVSWDADLGGDLGGDFGAAPVAPGPTDLLPPPEAALTVVADPVPSPVPLPPVEPLPVDPGTAVVDPAPPVESSPVVESVSAPVEPVLTAVAPLAPVGSLPVDPLPVDPLPVELPAPLVEPVPVESVPVAETPDPSATDLTVPSDPVEVPDLLVSPDPTGVPESEVSSDPVEVPDPVASSDPVVVPESGVSPDPVGVPESEVSSDPVEVPDPTVSSEPVGSPGSEVSPDPGGVPDLVVPPAAIDVPDPVATAAADQEPSPDGWPPSAVEDLGQAASPEDMEPGAEAGAGPAGVLPVPLVADGTAVGGPEVLIAQSLDRFSGAEEPFVPVAGGAADGSGGTASVEQTGSAAWDEGAAAPGEVWAAPDSVFGVATGVTLGDEPIDPDLLLDHRELEFSGETSELDLSGAVEWVGGWPGDASTGGPAPLDAASVEGAAGGGGRAPVPARPVGVLYSDAGAGGGGAGPGSDGPEADAEVLRRWAEIEQLLPEVEREELSVGDVAEAYGVPPGQVVDRLEVRRGPTEADRGVREQAEGRFPEVGRRSSPTRVDSIAAELGVPAGQAARMYRDWLDAQLSPEDRRQVLRARELGGDIQYGPVDDETGQRQGVRAVITREMVEAAGRGEIGSYVDQNVVPPGYYGLPVGNRGSGHLLARCLGGSGGAECNLVGLLQHVNNGEVARFEREVLALAEAGHTVEYTVTPVHDSPDSTGAPSALIMERHWTGNGVERVVRREISNRAVDYLDSELLQGGASIPGPELVRRVADKLGLPVEDVTEALRELRRSPENAHLPEPPAREEVPESPLPLSELLAAEFEQRHRYDLDPRGGHPEPESFRSIGERLGMSLERVETAYREYLGSRGEVDLAPRKKAQALLRKELHERFAATDREALNFQQLAVEFNISPEHVAYIHRQWARANNQPTLRPRNASPTAGADLEHRFLEAVTGGEPFDMAPSLQDFDPRTIRARVIRLAELHGVEPPAIIDSSRQLPPREVVGNNLDDIRSLLADGVPLTQVAEMYGITPGSLRHNLRIAAPEVLEERRSRTTPRQVLEANREDVLAAHRAGETNVAIARRYGLTESAVRRFLAKEGSQADAPPAPATDPALSVQPPVDEGPVAEAGAADPAGDRGAGDGSGSGSGGERAGDGQGPGGSVVAPEPDWTRNAPEDALGGGRPGDRVELPGGDGPVPEPADPGEFDPNAGDPDPDPVVRELEGYPTRPDEQLEDALTGGGERAPGMLSSPLGSREDGAGPRPGGAAAGEVVGSPALDGGGGGVSPGSQTGWAVDPQQGAFGGGLGGVAQVQEQLQADLLEAADGEWIDSTGTAAPAAGATPAGSPDRPGGLRGVGAWIGREVAQPAVAVLEDVGRTAWEVVQDDPVSARALPDGSGVRVSFAGGGWGDYDPDGYRIRGSEGTPDHVAPWRTPTVAGAFRELGAILEGLGKVAPLIPGLGGEQRQFGF